MLDEVKQTATSVASQAKEQVSTRLKAQFDQTAEGLAYAAEELRHVAQELRQKEQAAPVGEVTDRVADQVEQLALYLKHNDLDQLLGDVQRFARERPMLFVGGAFGLGLFAARLMKVNQSASIPSASHPRSSTSTRGRWAPPRLARVAGTMTRRARTTARSKGSARRPSTPERS